MNLPTPTPEEVRGFAVLYEREFGRRLSEAEAWEAATLSLQLFYLVTYGNRSKSPLLAKSDHPTTNHQLG